MYHLHIFRIKTKTDKGLACWVCHLNYLAATYLKLSGKSETKELALRDQNDIQVQEGRYLYPKFKTNSKFPRLYHINLNKPRCLSMNPVWANSQTRNEERKRKTPENKTQNLKKERTVWEYRSKNQKKQNQKNVKISSVFL